MDCYSYATVLTIFAYPPICLIYVERVISIRLEVRPLISSVTSQNLSEQGVAGVKCPEVQYIFRVFVTLGCYNIFTRRANCSKVHP